jgi:hypothetical protein
VVADVTDPEFTAPEAGALQGVDDGRIKEAVRKMENSHIGCFGVRASSLDVAWKGSQSRQDAYFPRQAGRVSSGFT